MKMIRIPYNRLGEFREAFKHHKMNVAASNVLYHTMTMLNKRHIMVDRDSYRDVFQAALNDIELTTAPIDAFIPLLGNIGIKETSERSFRINRNTEEYGKISERATIEWIEEVAGSGSALVCLLKVEPQKLQTVHDDLFIYYNFFKYLDQIDIIRVDNFSNCTKLIEYVVGNVTLDDWKDYIKTDKVNEEKYAKKCEDIIFNPDIASIQKFYMYNDDDDIPKIDVVNLMMRLATNHVLKDDMILVLAAYLTISFAMADFNNKKVEESPCAKYVRDVLCKL